MKHTPWKLTFNREADQQGLAINDLVDRDGERIAMRVSPYHQELLVSAPEMLQALERVRKAFPTTEGLNTAQSMAIGSVLNALYKAGAQ